LVIPVCNVEPVIEQTIADANQALAALTDDYEIIVVDAARRDETRAALLRAAAICPRVHVIALEAHGGEGVALRAGFSAATKDYVSVATADGRYDLRQLQRLEPLVRDGHIACGYRVTRASNAVMRWGSQAYRWLVRILLQTEARDSGCALKLLHRDALPDLATTCDGPLVHAELLFRARVSGRSVVEVGVDERTPQQAHARSLIANLRTVASLLQCWWSLVRFPGPVADQASATAPTQEPQWTRSQSLVATLCLALVAGALLLGNLTYALIEPDESRYAQVALNMLESGDWVVPRLAGEPYLDKPPLLYWVTAASLQVMGESELAARLPIALASWLTVLAAFVCGARVFGARAAWLGSLLLLLCLGFILSGRFLIMDGLLTLFTTIGFLTAWIAMQGPRVRLGWWMVSAVAVSLGVLTKGPIALVLFVPPLVMLSWLDRRTARLRWSHWLLAASILVLLTAPWFCLIFLRQDDFLYHFVWKHHVLRFVSTFIHEAPMWYYLPVLLVGMFPSSLLIAPTLGFLCSQCRWARSGRTVELGAACLAAGWIVIFFSLSSCKLPTYILPAVPLLSLVQGVVLHQLLRHIAAGEWWAHWAHRLPAHATDIAVGVGAGLAIADMVLDAERPGVPLINTLVVVIAILYAGTRFARRQLSWPVRSSNWWVAATASLLVMGFSFWRFVPTFAEYRSINANAGRICNRSRDSDVPVVYYDWPAEGSSFYLQAERIHVVPDEDLAGVRRALAGHRQALLITSPDHADQIQTALGSQVTLTRVRGARRRLYELSAPTPMHAASMHPAPIYPAPIYPAPMRPTPAHAAAAGTSPQTAMHR
jgi:dolichol-phosphate mannosyltransferase